MNTSFVSSNPVWSWNKSWGFILAAISSTMFASTAIAQQRNPLQTIGKTVVDQASSVYSFEKFTVKSHDEQRVWRVHVAIPKNQPAETNFTSFWMLDGNGALIEFDDELLAELAAKPSPPVLVFIGYDNDLRIDSPARTRDYTPLLLEPDEEANQFPVLTGGADAFLDVIERQIRPQVQKLVSLETEKQTIWAHSLGGMFVLHALFTRPGSFQTYISGSPSMWWGDAYLVREAEKFVAHNAGHPAELIIHLGGAERVGDRGQRDLTNPRVVAHLKRITAAPPDAAYILSERLKDVPGLKVSYREFGNLGHGPMFRASLMGALHATQGIADRSETPRPQISRPQSP